MAALYRRDARGTGKGAVVDACLYGSVLRILEWTIAGYDRLGVVREREGNRLANSAPLDNYPTADGKFVCIVAGSDANFHRLCKAMERPDLADEPRFARLADRAANGDLINGLVAEWTRSLEANEIERRCVAHDVPVATAYTAADIAEDPHMRARGDLGDRGRFGHRPRPPASTLPTIRRRARSRAVERTPARPAQRGRLVRPRWPDHGRVGRPSSCRRHLNAGMTLVPISSMVCMTLSCGIL